MSDSKLFNGQEDQSTLDNESEVNDDDLVDPRVQIELERLNTATDLINKLEIELDEARSQFRLLLSESSLRVNQLAKKLGSCVEKARPYYEARMQAKQLQTQTQKAALRYERASSAHSAAKEMVYLAEEGLKKEGRCFDPAWQEMLNHATLRVNEAESERVLSQREHQKLSLAYNESEKVVQQLHQELKKSIVKSSLSTRRSLLQLNNLANQHQLQLLPYFEMKAQFNQLLEEQRKRVHHLEENVLKMKMSYADALHNLEEISDEIHKQRKAQEKVNKSDSDECSKKGWAESKSTYQKFKTNSLSSEDIYLEHITSEDTYKSLPLSIKLRPGLVATSCLANHPEDIYLEHITSEDTYKSLPPSIKLRPGLVATSCLANQPEVGIQKSSSSYSFKTEFSTETSNATQLPENCNGFQNKAEASTDSSEINSSNIHKQFKELHISNHETVNPANLSNSQISNPAGDELIENKFLAPIDFNILRVQREELSDSESLASNDTADTLDDNQIECLLLEKKLSLDNSDSYEENNLQPCQSKKLSF